MRRVKRALITLGAMSVISGTCSMCTTPEQVQVLQYEEIPDEEIQAHFKETEQKEDISEYEPIQAVEARSDAEELPSAAIEVTYEEAQELMQIASAEALNQGSDGMWLVMSVVINRVNSPDYPDSIYEVIHQPYQFYAEGMAGAQITPEVHEALARIERGDIAPEIIAFETTDSSCLDIYFCKAFNYRDHQFYTKK